jgi:hypothetical protein
MLLMIAIGAFALAVLGENMRSVFLAVSLLCLILPYITAQRSAQNRTVDTSSIPPEQYGHSTR